MMTGLRWGFAAVAVFLVLSARHASAQNLPTVCIYNSTLPVLVSGEFSIVQCDSSGRIITSGGGGGGGGGAVTAASGSYVDGAIVTLGSKSDTPWAGTGSASEISVLKGIFNDLTGTLAISATSLPLPTGAATSALQPAINGDGGALAHVTNFPATQTVSGTVAISGTPAVTVSGTATVTGTVAISGTPAVSISGTPTVGLSAGTSVAIASATATSGDGTITTGGTAQNLFGGTTPTNAFWIFNESSTDTCHFNDNGTASATSGIALQPQALYETPVGYKPLGAVSLYCPTTGDAFLARRY